MDKNHRFIGHVRNGGWPTDLVFLFWVPHPLAVGEDSGVNIFINTVFHL